MSRPKILDLYCCEGGCSEGYRQAGFDPYGIDLFEDYNRKRYPFAAYKGDVIAALDVLLSGGVLPFTAPDGTVEYLGLADFFAISASPPCQLHSITNAARKASYPDLIGPTRERLRLTGLPYIIENVVGAPLEDPIELCGCMFDLHALDDDNVTLYLQRTRLFESNVDLTQPADHDHSHHEWVGGCYGGARRDKHEAKYVRKGGYVPPNKAVVQAYMGIDWMTWKGMHQSIPPAYTKYLGELLLKMQH